MCIAVLAFGGVVTSACSDEGDDDDDADATGAGEQVEEHLAAISELCVERNEQVNGLLAGIEGTPNITQIGEIIPIAEGFVTDLEGLELPAGGERVVTEAVSEYEAALEILADAVEEDDVDRALSEALPALGEADVLLVNYGAEGCGNREGDEEPDPAAAELVVTADEYSFTVEPRIPAGPIAIGLDNAGSEEHDLVLLDLKDDATFDDVTEAIDTGGDPDQFLQDQFGATSTLPGEQRFLNVELEPGRYVILCTVTADDGEPHYHKGQAATFEVTAE